LAHTPDVPKRQQVARMERSRDEVFASAWHRIPLRLILATRAGFGVMPRTLYTYFKIIRWQLNLTKQLCTGLLHWC